MQQGQCSIKSWFEMCFQGAFPETVSPEYKQNLVTPILTFPQNIQKQQKKTVNSTRRLDQWQKLPTIKSKS